LVQNSTVCDFFRQFLRAFSPNIQGTAKREI
jgi:hypothetical protein